MASPFPGMDPFVEMQEWNDFHPNFITEIQAQLAPLLGPKYVARVERRVYLERTTADDEEAHERQRRIPDVAIITAQGQPEPQETRIGTATLPAPEECIVPQGEERREYYLLIRGSRSHETITVLEVLSPTNKRPGADGRGLYLAKRLEILDGLSHFVELDLLRGGRRLPIQTRTPLGRDYYALVSRRSRRPRAEIYRWPLRQPTPTVMIPLAEGDPDVPLDLQSALANVYRRTRYELSINYGASLLPPLTGEEQPWIASVLARSGGDVE